MWQKTQFIKEDNRTRVCYKNEFESFISLSSLYIKNFAIISASFYIHDINQDQNLFKYIQELDVKYCKLFNQTDIPNQLQYSIFADPNLTLQNRELYNIVEKMDIDNISPNDALYQFICLCENLNPEKARSGR